MGHNLKALGSASLDAFGGLITFADARDVPEGASPRNWDVDYSVGSVFTRPGLQSQYSFATTLTITGFSLGSGSIATFTYVGSEPTVNEGFLLNGFTGTLTPLNGQTVYVESVTMTQFTALVTGVPFVTIGGLNATAVSTTGLFVGPNVGSSFNGPAWTNPSGISSATSYASVATGLPVEESTSGTTGVNQGSGQPWLVVNQVWGTGSFVENLSANQTSATLFASGTTLSIPADATVVGVSLSFNWGNLSNPPNGTVAQLSAQLAINGLPVGVTLRSTSGTYGATALGSSSFLWGTTFSTENLNNGGLGVLFSVTRGTSGSSNAAFGVADLVIGVYYTQNLPSGALLDQNFLFAIAPANGISGLGASFKAYSSPFVSGAPTSASLQLLQNGVPVGTAKTVVLTSTPEVYSLGSPSDSWGGSWTANALNNSTFGVEIIASGAGITYVGDLDITAYITPALVNFNWFGSYQQNNNSLFTLALDAAGNVWQENVLENPGVLSLSLTGVIPGSYGNGATIDNSEFVMFSDLNVGTDRPRQLSADGVWYPVSQCAPGAPPSFIASTAAISGVLTLQSYTWTASATVPNEGVANFTFTSPSGSVPVVGSIYVINGTGTTLDHQAVIVLGSPAPTSTTFSAEVTGTASPNYPAGPTIIVGTMAAQFFYSVVSITQFPAYAGLQEPVPLELSAGATAIQAGNVVTFYYQDTTTGGPDQNLLTAFSSGNGAWVYITGAPTAIPCNGNWQVIAMGKSIPPGASDEHWYFSFLFNTTGAVNGSSFSGVTYRQTAATITFPLPGILGLYAGSQMTITNVTGVPQDGWNNSWTVIEAVNSGQYIITSTSSTAGVATYGYQFSSTTNSQVPIAGHLITITGALQAPGYNGTFLIATVNVGNNTFTVNYQNLPDTVGGPVNESATAQAAMAGTVFTFDPGQLFVGTNQNTIYGNVSGMGDVTIIGTTLTPIGAGTRQAVVFFITASGNWTPVSNPTLPFTTPADANVLQVSNIPIGPSDVIARGIAITEAGANGVPGANFYVITNPVTQTVNGVTSTYTSTIINDNTSTTAQFSFTDDVLLNSTEIDIPGRDLFNTIELGSCAWCVPYSSRMFYGLQLNKVTNLINTTFDGGYQIVNQVGQNLYQQPSGWGLYPVANEARLLPSPVTGDAYYIVNNTGVVGSTNPGLGAIAQTAYQDFFNVPIIAINTAYSVRVACSAPSGIGIGTLVIDLVQLSKGSFGKVYGSFSVPLSTMGVTMSVFSGTLLTSVFTSVVDPQLSLRVRVTGMGIGADVLIDRFEVFPTLFPYLKTEVYGSYINQPEEIDASGDGGIIDTSTENPQACFGGFVLRDQLYLLKTSSMYSTRDNPNSEPGGWSLNEVSNRVGICGINAYDVGEEWAVLACRNGIYGFEGTEPELINLETLQIWQQINFNAGNTIVLRNDTENRRILCAVPLPTGYSPEGVATGTVTWLPFAPYNPAPTTPNVILVLNYQALGDFKELMASIGTHATMFGSLANPDMRRKWTIWQIPTPYMGLVTRANLLDMPLYFGNGIDSSKIYQLNDDQLSDDGVAINGLYTTYGHVNAVKAATLPIFGMHTKRYTVLQANLAGAGNCQVRLIPNDLFARYPYVVPGGITLNSPENDDMFRPVNCKGQRLFLEFSTNAVGAWFQLDKTLLTGKADGWSSLNPTGGGNLGIT